MVIQRFDISDGYYLNSDQTENMLQMYFKGTKLAAGAIKCPQKKKGRHVLKAVELSYARGTNESFQASQPIF